MALKNRKTKKSYRSKEYCYEPKEADILKPRGRTASLNKNKIPNVQSVSGKEVVYSAIILIKIIHLLYMTSAGNKEESDNDENVPWVIFTCVSTLAVPGIAAFTVFRLRPYTSRKLFLFDVMTFIVLGFCWLVIMIAEGFFLTNTGSETEENVDCDASIRPSHFPRNGFIFATIFGIALYFMNLLSVKNYKNVKL